MVQIEINIFNSVFVFLYYIPTVQNINDTYFQEVRLNLT